MRIIGNIETPHCKITVFEMGLKYSIKFESGLYEQTYKLRESSHINGMKDIRKLVDEPLLVSVMQRFQEMQHSMGETLNRFIEKDDSLEFEEII